MHQEWIGKLLELQEKDLRIFKLREQISAVPEARLEVEALLRESSEAVEEARKQVVTTEKMIKTLDMEAESLRARQRDFQSKSVMIRDNEDYRAALQQIEQCRLKISQCEDRELELMEELEQSKLRLENERKNHDAVEKRTRQMLEDLDLRVRNSQMRIDQLESERARLLEAIPADKSSRYERIMNSPTGQSGRPALVPVGRANMCGGCHMNVPAQSRVDAVNGLLATCPNCGAMLYYDDSVAQ